MKDFFRQSMAWLHTWVGLLAGWILFFVFITGTAGYLNYEIDRWMQPELPMAQRGADAVTAVEQASAWLQSESPPEANRWIIRIPGDRVTPYLGTLWIGPGGARGDAKLDLTTGEALQARDTGGGSALYVMHYDLHYMPRDWGWWIVGLCTMFMLVALVTGVIVHKKIFKDFFTFRPAKGQRSWLDAHNVVSVVSLPFQLMITYSGLVFFLLTYMPFVVSAVYGPGETGRRQFIEDIFRTPPVDASAGQPAPLVPLAQLVRQAEALWPEDAGLRFIDVRNVGDANARVMLRQRTPPGQLRNGGETLVFDGVSGELLERQPPAEAPASAFRNALVSLHEGHFAGPLLRALYVLSGLLGAAMVGTGLVLWTVKRRRQLGPNHAGLWMVERLNVGTLVGLPVGVAAYFWANRLLPLNLPDRAAWEMHALFIVWALLLAHAVLRPLMRAWREQLWMAAAAFTLLPLLNALTTPKHLLHSIATGDWTFVGFDLSVLLIGAVFAWAAVKYQRKPPAVEPSSSKRFRASALRTETGP